MLIQSGKPVGVFETHADAPRVLLANSNLVPRWSTWEHFNELDRKGLMMFGQMTAGSWIYIGSQGIVQGTYETFVEMGRQHYGGSLAGRWLLTAGPRRHGRRAAAGRRDGGRLVPRDRVPAVAHRHAAQVRLPRSRHRQASTRRWRSSTRSCASAKPVSVGLLGNAAEVLPELFKRGVRPDLLTDQTSRARSGERLSAHRLDAWSNGSRRAPAIPPPWRKAAKASMAVHVRAMLDFQKAGVHTVDYGNNIRQVALEEGVKNAFDFPGFVPAYIRPLFCRGVGPFRWVALSGDPEDIAKTDAQGEGAAARRQASASLARHGARSASSSRDCRRASAGWDSAIVIGSGLAFNDMVARGELKAPIVIGRDHLDSGSVASPNRETEGMRDGSDAVSDWPLLNALLNTASGATWVSLHHGGGVGMGFSQHAGVVIVCDGTEAAAKRIARVLWNDPATGVMRHADAGYDIAIDTARERTSSTCRASCR